MSLMKSLARVAAGVMLAKGLGSMMQQQQQSRSGQGSHRTGGGILGDLMNAGSRRGGSGGLNDLLGQVLGGRSGGAGTGRPYSGPNSGGASGGLGGILDNLTRNAGGARGGSGGTLGGLAGGAAAGGLGGLLGGILNGPAQRGAQANNDATFGEVFNDAVARQDEPEVAPTPEQNAVAGLMLRAMIQAAKADGRIDEAERERLLGQLGDLDDADRDFIRQQMAAPVDAQALAREVPKGLEAQVYLMSLMAIDFDSREEAEYLHSLADALGIDRATTNQIHEQVGVQNLYS
ncbi:tellurite resistance TerB family protein [Paracoccus sp. (in: a-proteobacteria)]|uniref:tellurite resistance TerB family protein n=1 Tax=Paracoccus sp. TaxID=267 RepID=UPI0026DF5FF1|nr:tellurite resistance TerB family protein [Paracoccus sp. (in: a-proteobacteria)]MDO5371524.1 tellurite resistance TerB family protein [Paracoccus sp. (in: a-proteobacteria)]